MIIETNPSTINPSQIEIPHKFDFNDGIYVNGIKWGQIISEGPFLF